jgi:hypothetical protein
MMSQRATDSHGHDEIAGAIHVDAVTGVVWVTGDRCVEVHKLPMMLGGELGDAAVKFEDLGLVVSGVAGDPGMEDGRDLAEDGFGVLLDGELSELLKVVDGDGGVEVELDIVAAAENDDRGVAVSGDDSGKAGEEFSGGVAVVAQVCGGVPPGFDEGVAEEGDVGIGFEESAASEEVKADEKERG